MVKEEMLDKYKIGILGLGYVGLPLAVSFNRKYKVVAFDINKDRVAQLKQGKDHTQEVDENDLVKIKNIFTSKIEDLNDCNFFIITVPTPIDSKNNPDLKPLISASEIISKVISINDIVVYESTVFPGATEEVCVPIIENGSKLKFNKDFFAGYSPERINPGDKNHRLEDIVKITSGSNPKIAKVVDELYSSIISAGTFKAPSIKVAEAAKVIENTQRDLNIALINELSIIFDSLNIDTNDVLDAASSKWNFQNFRPGLVGGHCIGVDPYYLTYKSMLEGYKPKIILSGRELNDNMPKFVSKKLFRELKKSEVEPSKSSILIMGFTFKENCPDTRNTKISNLYTELSSVSPTVDIYDPLCSIEEAKEEYKINIINNIKAFEDSSYDSIILAVSHNEIIDLGSEKIRSLMKKNGILFDLKNMFDKSEVDLRL